VIKLVYCLHRLSHLTREEFQHYWRTTHAPMVKERTKALGVRRYVQLHTLNDPTNELLQQGRGGPEPYDGIAELWWDSREKLLETFSTPEGIAAGQELLEDEKRFIDLERSPIWLAEENPVIEDGA
jgi:uncharacterized protein (TIGR02118 family)